MSGKTARRKRAQLRRKAVPTIDELSVPSTDAKLIYADLMLELMAECGIDETTCTTEEIHRVIAECSDLFLDVYDDYLTEVLYDGDHRAVENDLMFSKASGGMLPILMGM